MTSLFKSLLKVSSLFSSLSGYGGPPQDTDQQVDQSHDIDPEAQNLPILDYDHHSVHVEADIKDQQDHSNIISTTNSPSNSTDHQVSSAPDHGKERKTAIALEPEQMEAPLRLSIEDFNFPSFPMSRQHRLLFHDRGPFYCSGESSSSHDNEFPSTSTSFASTTYTNNSDSFRFPSSFSKLEAPTLSTDNPNKLVSESPTVVLVTENSPNNSTNPNNRSHRVLCSSNVFRKQELPRHFLILAISLTPVVMVLHFTSRKRLTWGMTVAVVFVLSTSAVVLWIANIMEEDYPVQSHRIQMLGFVLTWAGILGLVACFVWPSPYIAVPIALWFILLVIHGIIAYFHPT